MGSGQVFAGCEAATSLGEMLQVHSGNIHRMLVLRQREVRAEPQRGGGGAGLSGRALKQTMDLWYFDSHAVRMIPGNCVSSPGSACDQEMLDKECLL